MQRLIIIAACLLVVLATKSQVNYIVFENDSTTNFPNPERGFAPVQDVPWPAWKDITWTFCSCDSSDKGYNWTKWTRPIDSTVLVGYRMRGYSMVMIRYHLAEFRDSAISDAFIDRLYSDCATARKIGFKLIPRFLYNWPNGGPDAELQIVLSHIGQLKQYFQDNYDVINYVDLGLIGCFGEEHTSCHNLVAGNTPNLNTWKIIDSLFKTVPKERMIAVRYPRWKFRYFNNPDSDKPIVPLTEDEAYTGTMKSRWAQHDDCPVCGEFNCGSWTTSRGYVKEVTDFLDEDNRFVFQGGEPGDPETTGCQGTTPGSTDLDKDGYTYPDHASCSRILNLFEKNRYSTMSGSYGEDFNNRAYARWKKEGCYNELARRLGYRFRLIDANVPSYINPGSVLNMTIKLINNGFSSTHNPRGFEIILLNLATNNLTKLVITDGSGIPTDKTLDPRFWEPGKQMTINISKQLPQDIELGNYEVFMNLPDPLLYSRPEFSIRLANIDTWDNTTGFNSLKTKITVTNDPVSAVSPEITNIGLSVNPNPATTHLDVKYELNKQGKINIAVYDIMNIKKTNITTDAQINSINTITLNIEKYSDGLYFLIFNVDGISYIRKFVVQK